MPSAFPSLPVAERRAAPALLALCVLVSGCGDGGSSSKPTTTLASAATTTGAKAAGPPPATRVSHAQLVEIASGVCKQVKADFKGGGTGNQFTEIAVVAGEHAVIEERAAVDLAALIPPRALAVSWRSLVADRRVLAQELASLSQAAHEEDSAEIVRLEQSKVRRTKTVAALARSLGVDECATFG
jgi:hypothetical protein